MNIFIYITQIFHSTLFMGRQKESETFLKKSLALWRLVVVVVVVVVNLAPIIPISTEEEFLLI